MSRCKRKANKVTRVLFPGLNSHRPSGVTNCLGGWLPTSDACGRSPWHRGSGRPPESAQKRGAFHREPLPHFTPDLTRRTPPAPTKATPAAVTHRRTAPPPTKRRDIPTHPNQATPELERNPQPPPPPRRRGRHAVAEGLDTLATPPAVR